MVSGSPDLSALEDSLGHRFDDVALLRRALSHRSWVAEQPDAESNERLEFLGDAVLGFVIADLVFERFSDLAEGSLTDLRKAVVNQRALAEVARSLGLGEHIYLGRGEGAAGGGDKDSILSDAFEAVLGAVYLDGVRVPERHRRLPGAGPALRATVIPPGQLLVMGDNRGNSHDGRRFGFVAHEAVLGRAVAVFQRDGSFGWHPL